MRKIKKVFTIEIEDFLSHSGRRVADERAARVIEWRDKISIDLLDMHECEL
jgi:hypothetical protein